MGNCCATGYIYQNGCVAQQITSASGVSGVSGVSGASGGNGSSNNGNANIGSSGVSGNTNSGSAGNNGYGPYCLTINPGLHVCTSCLQGHYFDSTGKCV